MRDQERAASSSFGFSLYLRHTCFRVSSPAYSVGGGHGRPRAGVPVGSGGGHHGRGREAGPTAQRPVSLPGGSAGAVGTGGAESAGGDRPLAGHTRRGGVCTGATHRPRVAQGTGREGGRVRPQQPEGATQVGRGRGGRRGWCG